MAIEGYETITIVLIVAAIFLWGPGKLPELARAIGEAKREFDKASKETLSTIQQAAAVPTGQTGSQGPNVAPSYPPPTTDAVIVAAKRIGIETAGKTREEIVNEIVARSIPKSEKN